MKVTKAEIDNSSTIWATHFSTGEIFLGNSETETAALVQPDGTWATADFFGEDSHSELEVAYDEYGEPRETMSDLDRAKYERILDAAGHLDEEA